MGAVDSHYLLRRLLDRMAGVLDVVTRPLWEGCTTPFKPLLSRGSSTTYRRISLEGLERTCDCVRWAFGTGLRQIPYE